MRIIGGILVLGSALMTGGLLSLVGPAPASVSAIPLDDAALQATWGAEGGCERKIYPWDCWDHFGPVSLQCTTGQPVVDCASATGDGCGALLCSSDCTPLPEDHYVEDGELWGYADCRYDCGYWGSTFNVVGCAWVQTGRCMCIGVVIITGLPCPRGNYCKFFEFV
jgi:hypothetical protein